MFDAARQNEESTEVKIASYTVDKKLDYLAKFVVVQVMMVLMIEIEKNVKLSLLFIFVCIGSNKN